MAVIVQKFGGTSVANAGKIRQAAQRAVDAKRKGYDVVVVVSARGHKTDELVDLAAEITKTPRPREMDMLLSTGEQESVALMAMAVHELGEEAISLTGAQIGVLTDTTHTKARIVSISTQRMRELLSAGNIVIAAGFQGVDSNMNITTLGRGGSDTTATALAAVMNAELCEIYTDVEGVFTTDPRLVSSARKVERISYDEMLELASLGAGVMHSRSIEFAKKYRVHLRVGLFTALSSAKIPVDMVVQNVAREGYANVSFTVAEDELPAAMKVVQATAQSLGAQEVTTQTGLSKVSIVGHGMQAHTGVAARMFQVLAKHSINIKVVTTSEIKISVLIDRERCSDAVLAVHEGFELHLASAALPQVGYVATSRRNGASDASHAAVADDIVSRLEGMESILVSDVSADVNQSRVTLSNLPDESGIAEGIFTAIAEGGVLVDMIVQNVARDNRATISFTVPFGDLDRSLLLLREVLERYEGSAVTSDRHIGMLTIAGIGLRSHTDVGRRVFRTLGDNSINVQMINTSEIKLSIVISASECDRALQLLRAEFGLT